MHQLVCLINEGSDELQNLLTEHSSLKHNRLRADVEDLRPLGLMQYVALRDVLIRPMRQIHEYKKSNSEIPIFPEKSFCDNNYVVARMHQTISLARKVDAECCAIQDMTSSLLT